MVLLLVVFEVLFGGLVHDVETAECNPEDDFQSEDGYQWPESIVDEAQLILCLIKLSAYLLCVNLRVAIDAAIEGIERFRMINVVLDLIEVTACFACQPWTPA